jgi:5-(carboxyamino)imidazole ribonucleotide synthase
VLRTVQDRRVQRSFLHEIGAPQPWCRSITSIEALERQARTLAFRGVLKSAHAGYDGKGQVVIHGENDLPGAWQAVGRRAAVLEELVEFDFEISVLLARNPQGDLRVYPVALNAHRHQVLRSTVAPAPIPAPLEAEAIEIACRIAEALNHVGMMAIEMFVVGGTNLLVNEIAPRPHNSGHFTFGACGTSQFEQHVRAVLDLPLGDPALSRPAAMVNLFGDLWIEGRPDWTAVFSTPEAHLHLYDKLEPAPGRKMGHVLVLGQDPVRALHAGERILEKLSVRPSFTPQEFRKVSSPSVEQ